MKTKLVDCINQEISGRKYGHNNNGKGRLKAVSKNIDYLNDKKDYQYLNDHNRKIYKGYKTLIKDEL